MRHANAPSVSVIIPCYNAERFLAETLDSVLAQTFDAFELIVIDDGSTDATAAIIDEYRRRLGGRFVGESGPNRGVSAARNRGTELARGEYLQYLDADDLLRPDALRSKVEALERSGADVAYSDWQKLVESSAGGFIRGDIHIRRWRDFDPDPEIAVFTDFWAPPAALLYRRSIVDRIGGWSATLPFVQDGRFLFDAVRCGARLEHVRGVGADYRVIRGGVSLSHRDRAAFVRDWAEDAFEVEAIWRRDGELTAGRKKALLRRLAKTTPELYELDRTAFWTVYRRMHALDAGFIPDRRALTRCAFRVLGYARAEALVSWARKMRSALRRHG